MRKVILLVLGILAVAFAGAQFVHVKRTNPPSSAPIRAPEDILAVLDRSCSDCHTNQSRWPWYAHVAPASWLVTQHVSEGRANLNLSYWGLLPADEQRTKATKVVNQLKAGAMPLRSYLILHPEARLSAADRQRLSAWFSSPDATPGRTAGLTPPPGGSNGASDDLYDN